MKEPLLALVLNLACAIATESRAAEAGALIPAWQLVWADEFDQPDGEAPDPARWTYDLGGGGWGNAELQAYTSRRVNSRIEGGCLVIEARRERFAGSDGIPRDFTSARLKTKEHAAWTHGRIEARIQIPRGQGLWPAFWTLGTDIDQVSWPACGELDIMENIGREPSVIHGVAHGPGYSGSNGIGRTFSLPVGRRFADDFHLFAIEWETNRIRWLMDNRPYFVVTPGSLPTGAKWVFEKPHFVLLNVAVGGNWPGAPDGSTVFPQRLLVDFVRVSARTQAPAPTLAIRELPGAGVEVAWPRLFPHARLQRASRVSGPWSDEPIPGIVRGDEFLHSAPAGFYRLYLP